MSEYNAKYLDLKRRLQSLKIICKADSTSDMKEKANKLAKYDFLLKLLDDRYSDEKDLGIIETQLNRLEK